MQSTKLDEKRISEEQRVHDRLGYLLENLEEPEQEAVITVFHKLLDAFEKGSWQSARR